MVDGEGGDSILYEVCAPQGACFYAVYIAVYYHWAGDDNTACATRTACYRYIKTTHLAGRVVCI